ncbi:unnamed protein product, partial [marine sediment metagenome]
MVPCWLFTGGNLKQLEYMVDRHPVGIDDLTDGKHLEATGTVN